MRFRSETVWAHDMRRTNMRQLVCGGTAEPSVQRCSRVSKSLCFVCLLIREVKIFCGIGIFAKTLVVVKLGKQMIEQLLAVPRKRPWEKFVDNCA
jgi:hypothetical protein